jgi:hypothetical protein
MNNVHNLCVFGLLDVKKTLASQLDAETLNPTRKTRYLSAKANKYRTPLK